MCFSIPLIAAEKENCPPDMWHMKSQKRIINSSNFRIIRVSYWCCPTSLLSCAFSINPRWQSPSRSPSPLLGPAAQVSWAVSPHCLLPALAARAAPVEPHLPGATAFPGKQPWILKPVVVSLLFGLHLQKLLQRGGATLPKEDAALLSVPRQWKYLGKP